jgi:hypothetical protein
MRLAVIALLAACGGPTPPATPHVTIPDAGPVAVAPPDAGAEWSEIDWANIPHATDDDFLAIWQRLRISPDSWWSTLAAIPPEHGDILEGMARAFLREGNFACPSVKRVAGCTTTLELREVLPSDNLDSPCLRRQIALWALDTLETEVIERELGADMIALAGLPPPEDELNRAAFYRIEDETLRLQMLDAAERAGSETVADERLGNLSTSHLIEAARMHIDGAVDVLAIEDTVEPFEDAMVDDKLRPETRIRVAADFDNYGVGLDPSDDHYKLVLDALERGTKVADCTVASAAWVAFADLSHKPFPLKPAKGAKEAAILRSMCIVLSAHEDTGALWQAITPSTGIVWRSVFYGQDPDLEPGSGEDTDLDAPEEMKTWSEVRHLRRADLGELRSDGELLRSLSHCTGTVCTSEKDQLTFTFGFKKSGSRLLLDSIERKEELCPPDSP